MKRIAITLAASFALATPALAQSGGIQLPAPDSLTLLSLGVLGLFVGRRAASRRNRNGEQTSEQSGE